MIPPTEVETSYGSNAGLEAAENGSISSSVSQFKGSQGSLTLRLQKTRASFWEDAKSFAEGTIPQSVVIAFVVGIICGVAAYLYYFVLFAGLELIWHTLPDTFVVDVWSEWAYAFWIPMVGFVMCIGVGLSVKYLGDPGDLPYTIKCVHEKGYIAMDHVMPMLLASQFSILGGGSLGPEAPLVAICAALAGTSGKRPISLG
jgi:H+/Cl- antiporter ClcA